MSPQTVAAISIIKSDESRRCEVCHLHARLPALKFEIIIQYFEGENFHRVQCISISQVYGTERVLIIGV